MSLKVAVVAFFMLVSLVFAIVFFYWAFVYEVVVWHKSLMGAFVGSWRNWLLMFACLFVVGVCDSLIEGKSQPKVWESKRQVSEKKTSAPSEPVDESVEY